MKHHRQRAHDYVTHILAAALEIQGFVTGLTEEGFLADRRTLLAVVKSVEMMGEAAKQLSDVLPGAATRFPAIPLRIMYATRNRLIHGYAHMNFSVVYEIAIKHVPGAIEALEDALANWPADLT